MYDIKKQIIVLFSSLILSVVAGFIPSWTGINSTVSEQTLLTVEFFIAFLLLDILWIVAHRLNQLAKQTELWTLRENGDWELSNIRSSFFKIVQNSYGEKDLFVSHFVKEFHRLSDNIKDVADKQELRVVADHFLSVDNVLDAFGTDDERIWRFTWPLSENEKLFDALPWKRYFEVTIKMLLDKKIECIRAILILDDMKLVSDPRISKLLDFYHTNERIDCRIINREVYNKICIDNRLPAQYNDIGIYGRRLLFRTEQYEPETIGTFTKDQKLIANYISLFDAMWNSVSVTKQNPSTINNKVTLEDLFTFDEQH